MDAQLVSQIWWAHALRGVLATLFGVVALFSTGATLLALVDVFGDFAVLNGLFALAAAVRVRRTSAGAGWSSLVWSAWWLAR